MAHLRKEIQPGVVVGEFWEEANDGKVRCTLCPRECTLSDGQRGFCFVREARDNKIVLSAYGRSTGFAVDPIEKKPLNHFYPGTPVLSFGTAGCNLGCKFCQNWDISKALQVERMHAEASPEAIAQKALEMGVRSVAFTYNDPVIFHEYAMDTAIECHERGIKTVAVTAGYLSAQARPAFFKHIDAANIDLKAFEESFYRELCAAELQPVLDTLSYLKNETDVWVELTTLVIPGQNDSEDEIKRLSAWVLSELGPDVPLHFSAFHPDYKMDGLPRTPPETLLRSRKIALQEGLHHVYTGNMNHPESQSTYCHHCGELLIERDWYELGEWNLKDSACTFCGTKIAGHFDSQKGDFGSRRFGVQI
ncbi:AmmeMemoRadiSam system radical SAM enzyme [Myxococcota bacterium]|nr:AmmeMemoRadiSam system radical SAM enzyme [Myxococcota bacterium]